MTKKRGCLIIAGILAECLVVVVVVLAILPPQPGVTKANFDRIQEGMRFDEIQAILGDPAPLQPCLFGSIVVVWDHANGSRITVAFDGDEKAAGKSFRSPTETFSNKLRRWLHLPAQ